MNQDHSTVIDAFGGTVEVARICRVTKGAVSQWRTTGIPPARLMYLKLLRPELFADAEPQREAA
jgi:hypothetical protein